MDYTHYLQPWAESVKLSTIPLHIHDILISFAFYQAVFVIVAPWLSAKIAPKTYNSLNSRTRTYWNSHVVSMVQCLLINAMALRVIFYDPERIKAEHDWRERLWGYTPATGKLQGFVAGYFLWDSMVSVIHIDIMGVSSLLHGVAAFLITCVGFRPFANYYGANFILYELSTPFLNIHWFLDKFGMTGSQVQLVNGIALLISFAGCRLVWGIYQSVLIYHDIWMALQDRSPFSSYCTTLVSQVPKPLTADIPIECRVLPTKLALFYAGSNSLLTLLNFYWFSKMIDAVRKRFDPAESAEAVGNTKSEEKSKNSGGKKHAE